MKLLCDHMLLGVGHWLRVAGYDTAWASPDQEDSEIFRWAVAEDRLLLTCDRDMLEFQGFEQCVVFLRNNELSHGIKHLPQNPGVDWTHAPLTRCTRCNVLLVPATAEHYSRVPAESQEMATEINYCSGCDRVYWDGTHVERMLGKLQRWRGQYPPSTPPGIRP